MSGHPAPRDRRGRLAAIACLVVLAVAGCGKSVDERVAEARTLLEQGQSTQSMEILRDVLDEESEHPQANFLLARAYLEKGDLNAALWPLRIAAHRMMKYMRPGDEQRLVVGLEGGQGAAPVLAALEQLGGMVSQFQLSESRGGRELVATVDFPTRMEASKVAQRLAELDHVTAVSWAD